MNNFIKSFLYIFLGFFIISFNMFMIFITPESSGILRFHSIISFIAISILGSYIMYKANRMLEE